MQNADKTASVPRLIRMKITIFILYSDKQFAVWRYLRSLRKQNRLKIEIFEKKINNLGLKTRPFIKPASAS